MFDQFKAPLQNKKKQLLNGSVPISENAVM